MAGGWRMGMLLWLQLMVVFCIRSASGLGVNWGTISLNALPPKDVSQLLQANGIKKVKLFDAGYDEVSSLAGTGIEIMVATPNEMLLTLATVPGAADAWVKQNVTGFASLKGGVNIKYVAVGNEPFLTGYNGTYLTTTLPALQNIVTALANAGLAESVRAVIPFNADVLDDAPMPSATQFKADYLSQILPMLQIFNSSGVPFYVNLYPFISKYQDPNFPLDYAFFAGSSAVLVDGVHTYTNALDASLDALASALAAAGFPNMPIALGEIGWPTDGNLYATPALAGTYNQQLINHLQSSVGTPLRPNTFFEFYLFGLLDENMKSILPGPFERHWGMFYYDGTAKYALDFAAGTNGPAQPIQSAKSPPLMATQYCVLNELADQTNLTQNVAFACSRSDCTPLYANSSCSGLTPAQSASYAFNTYYQIQNQDPTACDFQGLAQITTVNPSIGNCRFNIGLAKSAPSKKLTNDSSQSSSSVRHRRPGVAVTVLTLLLCALLRFH